MERKKYRFRGKTYKVNFKGSPAHITLVCTGMIGFIAGLWCWLCLMAAVPV